MRVALAIVLFAALPALAAAQSSRPKAADAPTLPTIGLPLPQIGLPLPSIGLPPATTARSRPSRRPSPPNQNGRGGHGDTKGPRRRPSVVYVVPTYGWDYAPAAPEAPAEPAQSEEPKRLTGTLQLDVLPAGIVQLYADGYYVGTSDDADGELTLEAGPHRIEIRAPGYETATVDVMIEPGRTISYRGALVRQDTKPAPEPPVRAEEAKPLPRQPVYFIPGCYLGNVPPKDAGLPATCDLSRVKVLEP